MKLNPVKKTSDIRPIVVDSLGIRNFRIFASIDNVHFLSLALLVDHGAAA